MANENDKYHMGYIELMRPTIYSGKKVTEENVRCICMLALYLYNLGCPVYGPRILGVDF